MGVQAVVFESAGKRTEHVIPGVYTRSSYVPQGGGGVSANRSCIIGESKGGEPNVLYVFRSPSEARAVLLDGPLLEGVLHAFDPGDGLVPQFVGAMRTNVGAQASRTLKKAAADVIVLRAWDWGIHTNQLKARLMAGTAAGSHKVVVQYANGAPEVFDNITRPALSIQYIGAGAAATMSLTPSALTTNVDGSTDLNIDLASFPTIEDVVNYVNDQANYQAVLLAGDGTEPSSELDSLISVNIKASAFVVKADLKAILDTFARSAYIGSAALAAGVTSRVVPDYDAALVYFSGGTKGTTDVGAYTASLVALESEDVQIVGTTSTDEAVHLLIKDHCQRMSGVEGRKERMAWVGGASGETVDAAMVRAANLNTELVNLAYPGFTQYDQISPAKGTKVYSPAMYACKLLGQEVAVAVNEPVTNKRANVLSWNRTLTKSEITKLIQGGVTVGAKSDDGLLITVRAVTTYQANLLQLNERSMVREAQFMARDFRSAVKGDIGRPQVAVDIGTMKSILVSKGIQWNNQGLIVKAADKALVWGINIRENGDAVFVEYHTYLTAPRNFIFATANLHVLTQQVVAL